MLNYPDPEKKFNREIWWVLQKIKYISMAAREGELLEWVIEARPIIGTGMLPVGVRRQMLHKIELPKYSYQFL